MVGKGALTPAVVDSVAGSSPRTGPGPHQDRDWTDLGLILVRSYISPVPVPVLVLATSGNVQDRPGPVWTGPGPLLYQVFFPIFSATFHNLFEAFVNCLTIS